jgi:hypothetical protein
MRELQAINSKVNLITETGFKITQNNLKVKKKGKKKSKRKQNTNKKNKICLYYGNKRHYIKSVVAHVRRHDDRPLSGIYLANMERQGILVFYQ